MKNSLHFFFLIILILPILLKAQTVTGRLVDENGAGLSEVQLQLCIPENVYNTTSGTDGYFTFDNVVSGVEDNQLPTGYAVSNNFPNPFNPTTRIGITLPNRDNVKIEVFNLLGQSVIEVIERTFSMGTNFIDLELNGLPNGFYIARITIDDKHTIIKKMMLIYGSQHLSTNGVVSNTQLNKTNNNYNNNFDTNIDSLVATSTIIGRKTFNNLPAITGGTVNLGNLTIERYCPGTPTVTFAGKTYNTVQIGDQCWLKENLDVGTMILGSENQTNNGSIEKYCYGNILNNCTTYGGLYQWDETMQYVTTEGTQGICPTGWHIPKLSEFQTLSDAVGGDGNALKAIGQGTGCGAGTNTSGFSALLAGGRYDGGFYDLGYGAYFWSSTEYVASYAYYLSLSTFDSGVYLYYVYEGYGGFSVRCLKD
jgi:uncharacterized protein (TIGR02145 family)